MPTNSIFLWSSYCLLKKCKFKILSYFMNSKRSEIKLKNTMFDMRYGTFLGKSRPLCSNYTIELWVCWFMFNWRSLYYMANKFYTGHKDLFSLLIRYLISYRQSSPDQIWIMIYFKRKLGSHIFLQELARILSW